MEHTPAGVNVGESGPSVGQHKFVASGSSGIESTYRSPTKRGEDKMHLTTDPILPPCDYTIERTLGKGVFGEVFLATNSKGDQVALKRLPKSNPKFDWKLVHREVEVGRRLQHHEGIVKMVSYFETMSNIYLVFEYVDGSDLFTYMEERDFKPLNEREVKQYFRQLVDSLLYCHKNGVAHRDVKLDNIIMDVNGRTKLLDFGLASMDEEGDHGCSNFVGSPEYVAPEIIRRIPYSGYKADVYSLGMVLYCLSFGQFPFIPEQRFEALTNGCPHPKLEWPDRLPNFPFSVSKALKDLIANMIDVNPHTRISMQEVANHAWLTGKDVANASDVCPMSSIQDGINVC